MVTRPQGERRRRLEGCDALDACDASDLCCTTVDLIPFPLVGLHLAVGVAAHPREVARLRPDRASGCSGPGRLGVLAVRCYRRWASPLTPRCPQSPCCSAHAEQALLTLGLLGGVRAAWHRVRACGRGLGPGPG